MDRTKLAALVATFAAVVVGGVSYTVYQPLQATSVSDLIDAGISGPTHAATCPVRISDECAAWAAAHGVPVARYELADFPVFLNTLPDAGKEILLPPGMPLSTTQYKCLDLLDLSQCSLSTCVLHPLTCALWGTDVPVRPNRSNPSCVRRNTAAGFGACLFSDGGVPSEMTLYPAARLTGSCEPTPFPLTNGVCWVYAGDRAEDQ